MTLTDTSPMLFAGLVPPPSPSPPVIVPSSPTRSLWKWFLADSAGLESSIIGELDKARSRQLTLSLNKAGGAQFNLSMLDKMAALVHPITTALLAYKLNVDEGAWRLVWSGPVWTVQDSLPDAQMAVTAVGWQELLNHRLLREQKTFNAVLGGDIALQLLNYTNAIFPTLITPGVQGDILVRSRSYDRWQNIGQAIDELSQVEAGFDYIVDPSSRRLNVYSSVTVGGDVNLASPLQLDQPDAVFGYGWGPDNVAQFSRTIDSSTVMNRIDVSGKFATVAYPDPGDVDDTSPTYGLFEEQIALQDVVDATILQAYAVGEVVFRNFPRVTYQVTPFPAPLEKGRVPRPFIDYDLGHRVYLRARHGRRVRIGEVDPQPVRVFGMQVAIDDEGNERLGPLTLSAS